MNSFKKLSVGALMIASLTLTACAQDVPSDKDRVAADPNATIQPTNQPDEKDVDESETPVFEDMPDVVTEENELPQDVPEATEEEIKAYEESITEYPLGINLDESMEKYKNPEVDQVFTPADFDVKEGARYGLEFYQNLVLVKNFYDPRDASKDNELVVPLSEQMTVELLDELNKDVAENGQLTKILTATSEGTFADNYKGMNLDPTSFPISTWGTPELGIGYDDTMGNYLTVAGQRRMAFPIESGETIQVMHTYTINVVPSGESQWLVSGLDWEVMSIEVLK